MFYVDSIGRTVEESPLEMDCKTKQNVPQSIALAYIFLVSMMLFFVPLVFTSGVLGVIAKVWRNDLNVTLSKMNKRTRMAFRMQVERVHAEQLTYEDQELRKAFNQIDDDGSGTVDIKELGPLITFLAPTFLGRNEVLESILEDMRAKTNGEIPYHQMRELVTSIAEKVAEVEHDDLFREKFRAFDEDGSDSIDAQEMEALLRAFDGNFEERDARYAKSFLDEKGEMDCDVFVDMMRALALRKRTQQLNEEKGMEERRYLEVFRHAAGSSRSISRRRMALCMNNLNLTVSKRAARIYLRTVRMIDDNVVTAGEKESYPKSFDDQALIIEELERHFLFKNLSTKHKEDAMMAMRPVSHEAGDVLISEGEDGTEFFVLLKGTCDVLVDGIGKVHTYVASDSSKKRTKANAFGELALMHKAPRAATVTCRTPCDLVIMSLQEFRKIQARQNAEDSYDAEEDEKRIRASVTVEKKRRAVRRSTQRREMFRKIRGTLTPVSVLPGRNFRGSLRSSLRGSLWFGRDSSLRSDDIPTGEYDDSATTVSGLHADVKVEASGDADVHEDVGMDVEANRVPGKSTRFTEDPDVVVSGMHSGRFPDEEGMDDVADDLDGFFEDDGGILDGLDDDDYWDRILGRRCPRALLPVYMFAKKKWYAYWEEQTMSKEALLDESDRVTFTEYRRVISLVVMHKSIHYPETKYRRDFENMFPGGTKGCVPIDADSLGSIMAANNVELSDVEIRNELHALDRGDGQLLFDDFVTLMHRYHPEDVEHRFLAKLHDKANRLQRQLIAFIIRMLTFPLFVLGALILNIMKLILNIYLIAASWYGPAFLPADFVQRIEVLLEGLAIFAGILSFIPGVNMSFLEKLTTLPIDAAWLRFFTFQMSLKGGVTCVGMQAPLCK